MEQKIIVMPGRATRGDNPENTPAPVAVENELPEPFAALQPFVPLWALASETDRSIQRYRIGMEAIVAFKDAMLPQVDAIVAWLDGFPLDALPPAGVTLMTMLLSLAEIAPAVEFYGQPAVIDGYDPRRFAADETFSMRPPF